ncbi:hypothetical protein FGB62_9g25 [Gracilaria domingensis]|nr:hypothetical protein FGB62_9g25 [Gracilaria domingensis]
MVAERRFVAIVVGYGGLFLAAGSGLICAEPRAYAMHHENCSPCDFLSIEGCGRRWDGHASGLSSADHRLRMAHGGGWRMAGGGCAHVMAVAAEAMVRDVHVVSDAN